MSGLTIRPIDNGFEAVVEGIWREARKGQADCKLTTATGYYKDLIVTVTKDMWDLEIKILHQTALGANSDTKLVRARIMHDGTITYSREPEKKDWLMKVTPTTVGLLKLGFPDMSLRLINREDAPVFQLRRLRPPGMPTLEVRETRAGNGVFAAREMSFREVSAVKLAELARLRRGTAKEVAPAARMKSAAAV
jgi:hypothetical protein